MKESGKKEQDKKTLTGVRTFSVPFNIGVSQENIIITSNAHAKPSKEEIINQAIKLHRQGNIPEASKYYQYCINQGYNDHHILANYGLILKDLGQLQEAELYTRKAIELKPDFAKAYYSLSLLKYSDKSKIWQNQLFSESILKKTLQEDHIDIYFARANILHKQKNYQKSSKFLQLANDLKLAMNPSNADLLTNKSKLLLLESQQKKVSQKEQEDYPQSVFIVGMPRSGSSLLESILSMNSNVDDLGEINILEEGYREWRKNTKGLTLSKIYYKKINNQKSHLNITTNKWLFNYQYTGIIAKEIANAKIIHCSRNPLDNILSIYRAHFSDKSEYSSSLVDCAKIYLDQEKIMEEYKNLFRSKIYDLNYDSLVSEPNQEIKSLISWLGWEWNDSYLSPHLNPRSVSTASSVEVRSPINSKSRGGWKNYKEMLKPAIEILTKTKRYRDLGS